MNCVLKRIVFIRLFKRPAYAVIKQNINSSIENCPLPKIYDQMYRIDNTAVPILSKRSSLNATEKSKNKLARDCNKYRRCME